MKWRIVVGVALCLFLSLNPAPGFADSARAGELIPDLHVDYWINGGPVEFETGKAYVIFMWVGEWCKPCFQVAPKIEALHQHYANKGVVFLGLAIENQNSLKNKLKRLKWKLKVSDQNTHKVKSPAEISFPTGCYSGGDIPLRKYLGIGKNQFPAVVLIDRQRRVVAWGNPREVGWAPIGNVTSERLEGVNTGLELVLDYLLTENGPDTIVKASKLRHQLGIVRSFKDKGLESKILGELAEMDQAFLSYGAERVRLLFRASNQKKEAWGYGISLLEHYPSTTQSSTVAQTMDELFIGPSLRFDRDSGLPVSKNLSFPISVEKDYATELSDQLASSGTGLSHYAVLSYQLRLSRFVFLNSLAQPPHDFTGDRGQHRLHDLLHDIHEAQEETRAYGRNIIVRFGGQADVMIELASNILRQKSSSRDLELAIMSATAACDATKRSKSEPFSNLARALFESHAYDKAIEAQQRAIDLEHAVTKRQMLAKTLDYYRLKSGSN